MTVPYLGTGTVMGGRYAILREVGRGGYSAVYAAHDRELDIDVAVKLLVPPPASAHMARERMRREVQAVRRLAHPNIVAVYDFADDGPWSFIVMELVDGPDLAVRVRESGPLSVDDAASVGRDIAGALAVAHGHGILHRDVKPQNILLTGRAGSLVARLTDFGSAKLDSQATVTQTGGLVGTLDYAAPELIAGQRGDARADVYALGMTLFFSLTGRLPARPSPHLPPPPSPDGYAPRGVRPDVPEWLDSVVARATRAEAGDRFPSAAVVAQALADRVAGSGAAARDAHIDRCVLCGGPEPFGIGICPRCGGTPDDVADTLVVVHRPRSAGERDDIQRTLVGMLGQKAAGEDGRLAARGARALVRVPKAAASRVVEQMADRDIIARVVPAANPWRAIPRPFYMLLACVVLAGTLASAVALPEMFWTGPVLAGVLFFSAGSGLARPLVASARRPRRFPPDVDARLVETFASLAPGTARELLADVVRLGRTVAGTDRGRLEDGVSSPLRELLLAACGVALQLSRLDEQLAALEAQRERTPAVATRWLDDVARGERSRDALAQRLLDAVAMLGQLAATAAGASDPAAARRLADAATGLAREAELRAEATREVEALLAVGTTPSR